MIRRCLPLLLILVMLIAPASAKVTMTTTFVESGGNNYTVIKWTTDQTGDGAQDYTTWDVPSGVSEVDYLIVGGGGQGGGGTDSGGGSGGGGAGGLLTGSSLAVSGTETIKIGAGGYGSATLGKNGGNSELTNDGSTKIAYGGTGGAVLRKTVLAGSGGSTGGAGGDPTSSTAPTVVSPVQGYIGGAGQSAGEWGGDGADLGHERLSSGFERWYAGFGYTTAQYACAEVALPDGFADDSLTITVDWETESSTLGTCVLSVYGELIDDNDLSSVALTSPIATISDTNNGAGRRNVSAATTINPAGSGNRLLLRITRDYSTDTSRTISKFSG
jgi:hypothetical protein